MAVLCGTDERSPMQIWCAILPHAETQLNMLRKSAGKPTISAFEYLHGPHNYDYFEKEDDGLKEIERLTGNSTNAHGYGSINSAMEEHRD